MNSLKNIRHHFIFKGEEAPKNSIPENIRNQFREEMKNLVDEVHQADPEFLTVGALEHLESLGKKFDDINQKEKYKTFIYEYLESQLTGVSKETFRSESESALAGLEEILAPISGSESGGEAEKPKGDLGKVESEMGSAMEKVKGFKVEKTPEEFPAQYNNPNEVKQGLVLYNTRSQVIREGAQELSFSLASMQQAVGEYEAHKESKSFGSKLAFWKEDPQGEALEKNLKIFQYEYNLARKKLDSARAELAVQAPLLNEAPEKAKAAILADQSVEDEKEGTKSRIELLKENKELILKQKENLETQRKGLEEKAKDVEKSEGVAGSTLAGLLGAKESIEQALISTPNHPALLAKLTVIEGQINRLGAAKTAIKESEDGLNALLETKDGAATALELFATGMDATIASLEYSSQVLEQQIQLKEMTLSGIDEMDQMVAESILTNNINNDLLFQSVDAQWKGLPKEIGTGVMDRLGDAWGASIGQVGTFVKWGGGKMVEGLNWCGDGVTNISESIENGLNSLLPYKAGTFLALGLKSVTVPLQFTIGALKGVSKMVEGIGLLVESPLQVVKGLGALAGIDPETGDLSLGKFRETWAAMGSAIFAWEDLSQIKNGNFDKALQGAGEAIFNIASFVFTGGGAAGVKGAATAGTRLVQNTLARASKMPRGLQTVSRGLAYTMAPTTYIAGSSIHVLRNIAPATKDLGRNIAKAGRKFRKPKMEKLKIDRASLKTIVKTGLNEFKYKRYAVEKIIKSSLKTGDKVSLKDLAKIGITSADDVQRFYRVLNANKKIAKITERIADPKLQRAEKFRKDRKKKKSRREKMRMRWSEQGGKELVVTALKAGPRGVRALWRGMVTRLRGKSLANKIDGVNNIIDDLAQGKLAPYKDMSPADLALINKESLIKAGLSPKEMHAFYKLRSLKKFQRNLQKAQLNFEAPYGVYDFVPHGKKRPVSVKLEEILTVADETYRVGDNIKFGNKEGFILGITEEGHILFGKTKPPKGVWKKAGDLEDFIKNNNVDVTVRRNLKALERVDINAPKAVPKGASSFNKVRARFGKDNINAKLLADGGKMKPGQELLLSSAGKNYVVKLTKKHFKLIGKEQYKIFEVAADGSKKLVRKTAKSPFDEGFGKLMFDPEGTLAMPVQKAFSSQSVLKRMVTKTEPKLWRKNKLGDPHFETALKIGEHDVKGISLLTEEGVVLTFRPSGKSWNLVGSPSTKFNFNNQSVKMFETIKIGGKDVTIQGIKLKSLGNKGFLKRAGQALVPRMFTQTPSLKRAYLLLRSKGTRVSEVIAARQVLMNKIQELKSMKKYVSKTVYQTQIGKLTTDLSAAIAKAQSQGVIMKLFPLFKEIITEAKFLDTAFVAKLERNPRVAKALALTGLSMKGVGTSSASMMNMSPAALRLALNEESLDEDLPSFYEDIVYAEPTTKRTIDDGSDIKLVKHTEYKTTS